MAKNTIISKRFSYGEDFIETMSFIENIMLKDKEYVKKLEIPTNQLYKGAFSPLIRKALTKLKESYKLAHPNLKKENDSTQDSNI